jgi:hypothetical protein
VLLVDHPFANHAAALAVVMSTGLELSTKRPQAARVFGPGRAKSALYSPEILSMLLLGCESRCLTQRGVLKLLFNWHNKRIRFGLPLSYNEKATLAQDRASGSASSPTNARTNTPSPSSPPVFNVTYANFEIDYCVFILFHSAPGVKVGGRG